MTDHRPDFPTGTILGYPRIGRRRELKRAVEAHWAGALTEASSRRPPPTSGARRANASSSWASAATTRRFPSRSRTTTRFWMPRSPSARCPSASRTCATTTARSASRRTSPRRAVPESLAPLEMTKWFDTNYHYLVPEIGPETVFSLSTDRFVRQVAEARADGLVTRPVIVGPVTLLALSKATDASSSLAGGAESAGFRPLDRLDDVLPVYVELLAALRAAEPSGSSWTSRRS